MDSFTIAARPTTQVVEDIIRVAGIKGIAQVPGYKAFRFVRTTDGAVIVSRESGTEAVVPRSTLETAIEFVRENHNAYTGGPALLRQTGITHVTSPTWALIRLLSLHDLIR